MNSLSSKKTYKLVAIDLDGTLLNDNNQIDSRTKSTLETIFNNETKLIFASGRGMSGISDICDKHNIRGLLDYSVCFNGAYILDKNNTILFNKHLTRSDYESIHNLTLGHKLAVYAVENQRIITPKANKYSALEGSKNKISVIEQSINETYDDSAIYKIVVAGNSVDLDDFEKRIPIKEKKKYGIVRSHGNNLEFTHPLANKAMGLRLIADSIGVSLDEVMAIGDAGNDIEMISIAGKGVAMGNAFEEVKKSADYCTDSNNNFGVAKALEIFILNAANHRK